MTEGLRGCPAVLSDRSKNIMNTPASSSPDSASRFAAAAALLSIVTAAGSVWLSVGMKLKACPLCFYQRSFVMAVAGILCVGLMVRTAPRGLLCVLALTPALAGLCIAVFHVWLEVSGKLECPSGLFGLGSAPQQSAAMLGLLAIVVAAGAWRSRLAGAVSGAAAIGLLFAWACVASAPPLPPAPVKAYETPMDMCRPPFRG
jgi:disulfide bond formation protein DsbB